MDIDHFKKVNDSHGHQAGDEVLVEVARRLTDVSRDTDCVIRWGGEEFLVLFPETDIDEAAGIVERFRCELGGTPVSVLGDGTELHITVSGGVAELEVDDTAELLVARADAALYKAKESGRNRLLLAQSGELVPLHA
jgi:two-component system cell cycle response regulator